jgi:hypothetical protein
MRSSIRIKVLSSPLTTYDTKADFKFTNLIQHAGTLQLSLTAVS